MRVTVTGDGDSDHVERVTGPAQADSGPAVTAAPVGFPAGVNWTRGMRGRGGKDLLHGV